MYNNPYMNSYLNNINQQSTYENIDNQINKLQQLKEQMKNNSNQQNHSPAINQTFQLAPNSNNGMKYADSIDEVAKETIFSDTPFFSKDLSVMWIKNVNGNIKAYELNEIVKKDEKDIQIELLQAQLNELKGMIENAKSNVNDADEPVKSEKSSNVSNARSSTKKSKES